MPRSPTLISLFTGAGGLDLGLEEAGFHTVVANEIEPHACETLRQNQVLNQLEESQFDAWFTSKMGQRCHKAVSEQLHDEMRKRLRTAFDRTRFLQGAKIVEGDIRQLGSQKVLELADAVAGEIDLIAGGPPCQPFSRAGKRESVNTDTGKLFCEFVRLVTDIRPRWFLFENVKGLTLTRSPVARMSCKKCAASTTLSFENWLNYRGTESGAHISNICPNCSSKGGILVWEDVRGGSLEIILNEFSLIGYHCHHTVLNAADFGAPQMRERLIIVGSRDAEPFTWPKPTHAKEAKQEEPSLFAEWSAPVENWRGVAETLWPKGHWKYGKLTKRSQLWVKNVVRPHDEPVTWDLDRPSPTIGAHQGAKLAIAPSGVPEAQLQRQQWHTLGRRQGDTPPVFVEHEYLTDLELLRLQTFPDSWYLHGTRMERAFQIGNAVPPVLARAVGEAILASMHATVSPK